MPRKDLKRIELWLPVNHPIFKCPKGTWATTAKEWLDIGAELAEMKDILMEIKRMLESGSAFPVSQDKNDEKKEDSGFNPIAFAEKLQDFFG
ncbi:MAG: hypothetical protein XD50_1357 [Clostridia bacterium 41_269]|nr:MAG: hypothetical protein XD50_1357 [Clostridia bacterium 41_269]